jgi:hypothetical protein
MDTAIRRAIYSNLYKASDAARDLDDVYKRGLITLVDANAEIARVRSLYRTDEERLAAMSMIRPGDSKLVFGMFGLIFGSLPLLTVSLKLVVENIGGFGSRGWLVWTVLFAIAGVVTGVTGFALGRFVPAILARVSGFRLANRIVMIWLIGFCWGAVAGMCGGMFLFVLGAIAGAILGGIAGSIAVPLLVLFHSAFRAGDLIERKHFLPIVFGITLPLCAYILGA